MNILLNQPALPWEPEPAGPPLGSLSYYAVETDADGDSLAGSRASRRSTTVRHVGVRIHWSIHQSILMHNVCTTSRLIIGV